MAEATNSTEIWKTIPFAPDYAVSTLGRVRRETDAPGTCAGRILSTRAVNHNGYRKVTIRRIGRKKAPEPVHRLVALTFLGPSPSPIHQVAHNDGVRTNNHLSNLRWATQAENSADTVAHASLAKEKNPACKVSQREVSAIRKIRQLGIPFYKIAAAFDMSKSQVQRIVKGQSWAP